MCIRDRFKGDDAVTFEFTARLGPPFVTILALSGSKQLSVTEDNGLDTAGLLKLPKFIAEKGKGLIVLGGGAECIFGVVVFDNVLSILFSSLVESTFKITDGVDFLLETLVFREPRFLPTTPLPLLLLFADSTGKADVNAFLVFFLIFVGCLVIAVEGEAASNEGLDLTLE